MSDTCWVPGCRGRIVPSRDLRSTVARGGECPECGALYKRYGSGDWKFVTEIAPCAVEGCGGTVEFEVVPKNVTHSVCDACHTRHTRSAEGEVVPEMSDATGD